MTAREFDSLPDADKRTVLVSALEHRENAVRNVQASSVTHVYNVEYRDGKTGPRLNEMGRYVCELRRKDGNHWASVDWYVYEHDRDRPLATVVTTMDAESGQGKSVARHRQMKGTYGVISTEEDHLIQGGHFHYWFDAKFDKVKRFPIRFLLEHQDAIKFEGLSSDGQQIKISLLFEIPNGDPPYRDFRTVWIDPQRAFMPVQMHEREEWLNTPTNSDTETDVKKMENVDGVWFPTHITVTSISPKSIEQGYAGVDDTIVSEIKVGVVTDDDLQVHFADGVEVHDRIKGVRFVASEANQSAPAPSYSPGAPRSAWLRFFIVNLVAILALSGIFILSRRRRKQKDALAK